jgi:hypothetical protein
VVSVIRQNAVKPSEDAPASPAAELRVAATGRV